MHTVVLSHAVYKTGMEILEARKDDVKTIVMNSSEAPNFLPQLQKADGILMRFGWLGGDILRQCPKLKVISRSGIGVDNVDVDAAAELGLPIVVTPGANTQSVAEHTMALIYAITKDVVDSCVESKAGNYLVRNKYMAIELQGRSVGVVGFGKIGRVVAKLLANNGLVVHAYDPYVTKEQVEVLGYQYAASLHELLGRVDIVTLHLPSLPETKGIMGKGEFVAMRDDSFLVNCARGDLIDEGALYDALSRKKLAGAAVDILTGEPFNIQNPLFTLPNFIATPHTAGLTQEASASVASMAVEGMLAILDGKKWPHVYDSAAYEHPRWKGILS